MTYKSTPQALAYARRAYHTRRGNPIDPPPGHIGLPEAARRLCYSRVRVWQKAQRGDFGPIWQRAPRGPIYIREEAIHGR